MESNKLPHIYIGCIQYNVLKFPIILKNSMQQILMREDEGKKYVGGRGTSGL